MKNKMISLRVTEEEYNSIKQISDNLKLSVSDYIMSRINSRDDTVNPIIMTTLENIRCNLTFLCEELPKDSLDTFSKEVDTLWRTLRW